jgi:Bacterial dnaA protein helix-turn-helix
MAAAIVMPPRMDTTRRCWCGTVLSQSNHGTVCRIHKGVKQHRLVARLGNPLLRTFILSPLPKQIPQPKPQPQTPILVAKKEKAKRKPPKDFRGTATQIVNAAGRVYNIDPRDIMRPLRRVPVLEARQVSADLIVSAGASFAWTGRFLGQHHTNIIHGHRKIAKNIARGNVLLMHRINDVRELSPHMPEDCLLPFERLRIMPNEALAVVASLYGIRTDEMLGKCRRRPVVQARRVAMYLYAKTGRTPVEMGVFFQKNPRIVRDGILWVTEKFASDAVLRGIVEKAETFCSHGQETA